MALTPNEERKKTDWFKKFGEDLEIRGATREIARKNKNWYFKIWLRQHQVEIMYLWMKINWSSFANSNLPYPPPIDRLVWITCKLKEWNLEEWL